MTREEIKRLPFVAHALRIAHPYNSTCGICGLPWGECKGVCIEIDSGTGCFYVCDYCFSHSSLEEVLKATAAGYVEQYKSIAEFRQRESFVQEYDLVDILMRTQERYLEINKIREEYDKRTD